jgi:hypothetical protein
VQGRKETDQYMCKTMEKADHTFTDMSTARLQGAHDIIHQVTSK